MFVVPKKEKVERHVRSLRLSRVVVLSHRGGGEEFTVTAFRRKVIFVRKKARGVQRQRAKGAVAVAVHVAVTQ